MNRLKILLVIIAFAITVILATPLLVNPILKKKILLTLHQKYPGYDITTDKVKRKSLSFKRYLPARIKNKRMPLKTKASFPVVKFMKHIGHIV